MNKNFRLLSVCNITILFKQALFFLAYLVSAVVFIPSLDHKLGLYFNFTDSMPKGIYRAIENKNSELFNQVKNQNLLGKLVILCTNELSEKFLRKQGDGLCANQRMPLLKKVIGINGDVISINEHGVFVNGRYQMLSKPLKTGINNEALPKITITNKKLSENEIIVLGNTKNSWDSRYWGIADVSQIIAIVKPLLVF